VFVIFNIDLVQFHYFQHKSLNIFLMSQKCNCSLLIYETGPDLYVDANIQWTNSMDQKQQNQLKKYTTSYNETWSSLLHSYQPAICQIQSMHSYPISLRYIIISSHLYPSIPSGPFLSDFPDKFCTDFSFLPCVLHAPPTSSSLICMMYKIFVL
jgi:hypothetical protein